MADAPKYNPAKNVRSLRTILGNTPTRAKVVSVEDLKNIGGAEIVAVLVQVGNEAPAFYADTVVAKGSKPAAGQLWNFTADANNGFPVAELVADRAEGEENAK